MKAEELELAVVKALTELNPECDISVEVKKAFSSRDLIPADIDCECFHIRLQGCVFMDDLNAVVEATGDKNIIIDGHPEGGLDIFCSIKNKE